MDTYVRLQMAGIPKEKIVHMRDEVEAASNIKLDGIDTIFILYDIYTIHLRDAVKKEVETVINDEEKGKE